MKDKFPGVCHLQNVAVNSLQLKKRDQEEGEKESHSRMETCLIDKPFQICKPLAISMCWFGLLFVRCKKKTWAQFTKAYSTVVILFLWANFVRLFFVYGPADIFGPALFFKVVVHLWYLLCCLAATSTYKACNVDIRFVEFLERWSRLMTRNRSCTSVKEESYSGSYESSMKLRFYVVTIVGWTLFLLNSGCNGYIMFETNLIDFLLAPMTSSHNLAIIMKCVLSLCQIYVTAAWIFTLCLFFVMASVIYGEFEIYHKDFRDAVSRNGDSTNLEYFRRRHQEICQLVETADDILRVFNAAGLVVSTCDGMLLLYTLVWFSTYLSDPIVFAANCFWLVSSFIYLIFIGYGGGYLNHMAHLPLKIIHEIKLKDVSTKLSLQMNMFLAKLTGESIGLTAMDMFVIDKPTILTIFGAFITYFIVLIQFQQPTDSAGASVCNCTELLLNSSLQCYTNLAEGWMKAGKSPENNRIGNFHVQGGTSTVWNYLFLVRDPAEFKRGSQ